MQTLSVVLDVSSILWDEEDYGYNTDSYYDLADSITELWVKLEQVKPEILLSDNLRNELMGGFPFGKPPHYGEAFESQTLSFLSKVQTIDYGQITNPIVTSIPDLKKTYYTDSVKTEIDRLVSTIHYNNPKENVYFTFRYLWSHNGHLTTNDTPKGAREHEVVISDNENALDHFFATWRLIFEHHIDKHSPNEHKNREAWLRSNNKSAFVSQLSCYDPDNNSYAQELLNKRYRQMYGHNRYYTYDYKNEVYVVFRQTNDNVFHAHDEYDIHNIPHEVKKHFNVNKYSWS